MMGKAVLTVVLALPPQQAPDSAEALRQARELVSWHYAEAKGLYGKRAYRGCTGVSLQDCKQGDWSCPEQGMGSCIWDLAERRAELIPELEALAHSAGNSAWLYDQRVAFAIKNDELERADAITRICDGVEWWCQTLRGLTAHLMHPGDGLAHYDTAFALLDEDVRRAANGAFAGGAGPDARCEWSDIRAVAALEMLEEVRSSTCPGGQELQEMFWWLADPLWTREGNERYAEHLSRQVMIRMDVEVQQLLASAKWPTPLYEDRLGNSGDVRASYEHIVREGFPNSQTDPCWDNGREPRVVWACRENGAVSFVHGGYGFAPDAERLRLPLESTAEDWAVEWRNGGCQPPWNRGGCGERPLPRRPNFKLVSYDGCLPPWRLEDCGPERMITRKRWHNLDHQTVGLRRDDQLLVVSAARVPRELGPREALEPALALGRVATREVRVVPAAIDDARTFRATARVDSAGYLASIEVVGKDEIGRARFGAPAPVLSDGFGVSDLALVDPRFERDSLSLEEALLPSLELPARQPVGLYFEIYGLAKDDSVDFTLTSGKLDASILQDLARFLRIRPGETPIHVTWTGAGGEAGISPRFFTLDPSSLDKGEYRLTLTVRRNDGREAVVSRRITLR